MPFRSLFNRKGSQKNQSKNKSGEASKQNDPSALGSTEQVPTGESCTGKSEVLHEDWTSEEQLEVEGKNCPVIEGTQILQKTQTKNNDDQALPCDIQCETNSENDAIGPKEDEMRVEKSAKNLSSENVNLNGSGSSQHNVESVHDEESCPDINGQEHQNSILSYSTSVPISQNSSSNEEDRMKAKVCIAEQCDCVSEKLTDSEESRELKDTNVNATEEMISNVSQEMRHWEDNDAVNGGKVEIPNFENEVTEVDTCSQKDTPKTSPDTSSSLASEFSSEESFALAEINNPKQEATVLASVEPVKDSSSVVPDTHETESEGTVTDCGDHTNSDVLTETAPENSVDIYSMKLSSENNSITDCSASNKNEEILEVQNMMTSDSQNIPDEKQSFVPASEKTRIRSCPYGLEHEGVFQETASSKTDVISNKNDNEHVSENAAENREQDTSIEICAAFQIQEKSLDVSGTSKETDYVADKSIKSGNAEHDTTEVQDNELIPAPLPSATTISSEISPSTDDGNGTGTAVGVSYQNGRISSDVEGTEAKGLNDGDSYSEPEILENNPSLTADEVTDINSPRNLAKVPVLQSESSVEDSFDSFPSECEDFLGGQRTLMATEQHPPPSWKVGYLQVKLPTKSRGRGKLKVWRQRWVVIQMDEFVKDTKNPSLMINIYASECSNARRHSALFWCAVSASETVVYRSQSKTHKYAFSISVDNDVVLHLAADSETASQEWMASIRNLLWPPNPVLELEKVLHGSDFEVSIIDNEFSFHAGLLGTYGNMKVTSTKLIFSHPQTDHVIQEWYLNTLDKFQLMPQSKEADALKTVVMHTGTDSSTGSGQIILFCSEAVTMLQCIASTIHKLLQYKTTAAGKDQYQKELAKLAEWLPPAVSPSLARKVPEDYYKVPPRQIRSLLDIPKFSFEKPLSNEGLPQNPEPLVTKPSMLPSATSASTFSEDSGISMATQPDDFLNCSVTSFTIGGRPVRDHTSSESSDGYSPPCSPEMQRKEQETVAT